MIGTPPPFSRASSAMENHAAGWEDHDWIEPPKPKRDWKKALLVLGLGTLSWVATYVGMLELIQANMGTLSILHKVVIGFSVAMLMTMIIWLLDQMFAPLPFATKAAYVVGYLFLTLISVGFGFGFYWKVLESRSEASRSAESAIAQVQSSLFAASSRLDQLRGTLDQLNTISAEKAVIENKTGGSCPNSRPGDGPRRKLRDADAAQFGFAANFVRGRASQVKSDMKALNGDLKRITAGDPSIVDPATGTRNKFLQALTRKLERTATGFNAFRTDPQLRQVRSELADRSTQTVFPTGRGNRTFSCPDPQLQSALRGVVRAIDQLPELGKPKIATVEGAQAVVEAFRRLTATLHGIVSFKLPPSADELRDLQRRAVQSVDNASVRQAALAAQQGGLSQRDYIPLAIAMFVDICLFLVSIGRPMNRFNGLVPKMRAAEHGPVYQILSRFDDIHRDEAIRSKFEMFRHVVFDFSGDYYVAVPLDAPRQRNPEEVEKLQLEAHLLGNLFASFEKERIFTRVYNPLLSRKVIERKLERQGSKFAASSAFRVYRFRDGAWSDVILGAVMGASRRPSRHRQQSAGGVEGSDIHAPSLPIPPFAGVAGQPGPVSSLRKTSAPEPANDTLADDWPDPPCSNGESPPEPDDALRAKFGPYAANLAKSSDTEPDQCAGSILAATEIDRPVSAKRRRRLSLLGRLEALEDSPDGGSAERENIIPMPGTCPGNDSTLDDASTRHKARTSDNGTTVLVAHRQDAGPIAPVAPDIEAEAIRDGHSDHTPANNLDAPHVQVRLVERTAEYSLPTLEARFQGEMLRTDRDALSVDLGRSHETDHVVATSPTSHHLPIDAPAERECTTPSPVADETNPETDVTMPIDPAHMAVLKSDARDEAADYIDASPTSFDTPDPMLQVARRFAANTSPRGPSGN